MGKCEDEMTTLPPPPRRNGKAAIPKQAAAKLDLFLMFSCFYVSAARLATKAAAVAKPLMLWSVSLRARVVCAIPPPLTHTHTHISTHIHLCARSPFFSLSFPQFPDFPLPRIVFLYYAFFLSLSPLPALVCVSAARWSARAPALKL